MRSKHYQNASAFMPWSSASEALEQDWASWQIAPKG